MKLIEESPVIGDISSTIKLEADDLLLRRLQSTGSTVVLLNFLSAHQFSHEGREIKGNGVSDV